MIQPPRFPPKSTSAFNQIRRSDAADFDRGMTIDALLKHVWIEEKGSALVDWFVLGAGAASLCVALAATVIA